MKHIRTFDSPRPHIIIEDFYTDSELYTVLEEIKGLEPKLETGKLNKHGVDVINKKLKNNDTLVLDAVYNDTERKMSPILTKLDQVLWAKNGELRKYMLENKYPCFEYLKFAKVDNTQLSVYGNGKFFDYHCDNDELVSFCTVNIVLCNEPRGFSGGDLMVKWHDDIKTISFTNNTCYVFPMSMPHRITPVVCDGQFKNYRYSINNFARVLI